MVKEPDNIGVYVYMIVYDYGRVCKVPLDQIQNDYMRLYVGSIFVGDNK